MGKDTASKVLIGVAVALGVVLVIGVLTFAGPCMHADGSASACQQSQTAIMIAGVVAAIASLVALFMSNGKVAGALLVVAAIAGACAAILPGNVTPLCMMATMHCRAVMLPFAEFMGAALAAVSLIAAIRSFRARS